MRWGRVGKTGQTATFPCGPDLDEAKRLFCNKWVSHVCSSIYVVVCTWPAKKQVYVSVDF